MKVLGIIAEYNPFHNGHLFHLEQSKLRIGADYTVAVMSGNFTQRGEPAMADKWIRAQMAVENGVDLVLEIPFVYACNNAEYFAEGAVKILEGLGCVTHLSFGSESGNLDELKKICDSIIEESEDFKLHLKNLLSLGVSYPKARQGALEKCMKINNLEIISKSNNILGIEYLKQLAILNSKIIPFTIERKGASYSDTSLSLELSSAMAIRKELNSSRNLLKIANQVPQKTFQILSNMEACIEASWNDFYQMICYRILSSSAEELSQIFSVTEGLENRLKSQIGKGNQINDFIENMKTKRYTTTRIQRIIFHTLLSLTKDAFYDIEKNGQPYGRVLGFNKKGTELLSHMKKNNLNSIPIITNINKEIAKTEEVQKILKYDILATEIYSLGSNKRNKFYLDYVKQPYHML